MARGTWHWAWRVGGAVGGGFINHSREIEKPRQIKAQYVEMEKVKLRTEPLSTELTLDWNELENIKRRTAETTYGREREPFRR